MKHSLVHKNKSSMTGVCAKCGPVRLRFKNSGNGRPRQLQCVTARAEQRRKEVQPHGLTRYEAKEFCRGKSCAVCGSEENLVVDHDHQTGEVRGILCRQHNSALGMLGDSKDQVIALLSYLEKLEGPGS